MSRLVPFEFEGNGVRVIDRDGDLWFVLADVCGALGIVNPSEAAKRLDADEKDTLGNSEGGNFNDLGVNGAMPIIINEGGLYTLVLRSHGATTPGKVAYRFRKWVTSRVLPAIRRTGSYTMPGADPQRGEVAEVKASVVELRQMFLAIDSPENMARAEEFRPQRVWEDGIAVCELVDEYIRPDVGKLNFRSISAKLTVRLTKHCESKGLTPAKRIGAKLFPRIEAIKMTKAWKAELIRTSKRDDRQLNFLEMFG